MVFASEFAAIGRVSTRVLASGRCRYACSVNASSIPHDLVVLSEPSENRLVDTLPNAGSHPFVESTPAFHATATAEFARQVLPRYSSLKDKQDSRQSRAIINTWPSVLGRKRSWPRDRFCLHQSPVRRWQLDFSLLRDFECIIDFYAKIPHRALELSMAEE